MNNNRAYSALETINGVIVFGVKDDDDLQPQKYIDFD